MKHLGLAVVAFVVLSSCRTLDDRYPEVAHPVTEVLRAGTLVVHDRSQTTGENFMDIVEMPPDPKAPRPRDPNQVTIETNVVLLKRGTWFTTQPYELLVEGSLEGAVSGEFALEFVYGLQSNPDDERIETVRLPWDGRISRVSWTELGDRRVVPALVQYGLVDQSSFRLVLTRGRPLDEDPISRWTLGLLMAPVVELLYFLDPPIPNSVILRSGFVSPRQRFQLLGEDGVVWGELEGDTYRVFATDTTPPTEEVIKVLAMVRLEVWIFKTLVSDKPPSTRNPRYLPKGP